MKTETANTLCPICGGKMDFKHVMNTGDSDTNKTTIFLEYMNEIYVDRDFYSRGKIIEMAKDKYVELHGNVNNNKEFNSLATKCGFENYTSMLKSMETHGITIVEVDPLLTNSKDDWVSKTSNA